jgi:hypothetical protein
MLIVNINGTSQEELLTALIEAHHSLNKAHEAMLKCLPHGRDFPNGGFADARKVWDNRIDYLRNLQRSIIEDAEQLAANGSIRYASNSAAGERDDPEHRLWPETSEAHQ